MTPKRERTVEAALGQPSTEHFDACGQLQVPYLSWSYYEIRMLGNVPTENEAQHDFFYELVQRRLPALTVDEFDRAAGPPDVIAWIQGAKAPEGGEGNA